MTDDELGRRDARKSKHDPQPHPDGQAQPPSPTGSRPLRQPSQHLYLIVAATGDRLGFGTVLILTGPCAICPVWRPDDAQLGGGFAQGMGVDGSTDSGHD